MIKLFKLTVALILLVGCAGTAKEIEITEKPGEPKAKAAPNKSSEEVVITDKPELSPQKEPVISNNNPLKHKLLPKRKEDKAKKPYRQKKFSLKHLPVARLAGIVSDIRHSKTIRWYAMCELARRKDPSTKPLLIKSLKDGYQSVRGAAAWGLSQIGGKDAQDALLGFLRTSLESKDWADLTRATEAQKELPDTRALDLLIKCLQVEKDEGTNYSRYYAAEALGKVGDPKASLVLAQQLDISIDYSMSRDYLYLEAIRKTKGREALPFLVDYLNRLVKKMAGQDVPRYLSRGYRQVRYNFRVYNQTLAALHAITGRQSKQRSRDEVAQDWMKWLKGQSSEQSAPADK